jgi:hypothetical protein
MRQYGLIAEEVAKLYPELATRGSGGAIESVQYDEMVPMLLNELLRQEQELRGVIAQNAALSARIKRLEEASRTSRMASR